MAKLLVHLSLKLGSSLGSNLDLNLDSVKWMRVNLLLLGVTSLLSSCSNNNMPRPLGDSSNMGICARAGEEYKNPISNDFNQDKFEKVQAPKAAEYFVSRARIFFKEDPSSPKESPLVQATHDPVFLQDSLQTTTFLKNCARLKASSASKFETALPVKLNIRSNGEWAAAESAKYTIEYNKSISSFLDLKVQKIDEVDVSSGDSATYAQTLILKDKAKEKSKEEQEKEEAKVAKKEEPKKPEKVYLQIQISQNPEAFARLTAIEILKKEEQK